jgi:broad specificity phosphatase PhoE
MSTMADQPLRTRLLLLCRGAADWSRADDRDPPLSAEGRADAEIAAASLPGFDSIVASPQRASEETAAAIGAVRQVPVLLRDGLDEIRAAVPIPDADAYAQWVVSLFESYGTSPGGESLAEGTERLAAALRAIGDMRYGRTTLVISHPIVLAAFRGSLLRIPISRAHADTLPDLGLAVVDYLEGRFYLVQDFPTAYRME